MRLSLPEDLPITIRRSRRARRMALRMDPVAGGFVLVLPESARRIAAERFVFEHQGWMRAQLAAQPPLIPFEDGIVLPLRGLDLIIRHHPIPGGRSGGRGPVWVEGGAIRVTGAAEHLRRRLTDWLKAEARRDLTNAATEYAAHLGRPLGRVTIRDTRSRWGSCSSSGNLAFSWRLILAPAAVLAYVAAHEAAHLIEPNHSPAFWRLVRELCPDYEIHRHWLRRNGNRLLRYGQEPPKAGNLSGT